MPTMNLKTNTVTMSIEELRALLHASVTPDPAQRPKASSRKAPAKPKAPKPKTQRSWRLDSNFVEMPLAGVSFGDIVRTVNGHNDYAPVCDPEGVVVALKQLTGKSSGKLWPVTSKTLRVHRSNMNV